MRSSDSPSPSAKAQQLQHHGLGTSLPPPAQSCVVFAHGGDEGMQVQSLPEKIRYASVAFNEYVTAARDLHKEQLPSLTAAASCPALVEAVSESADVSAVFNYVLVPELNSLMFHLASLVDTCCESHVAPHDLPAALSNLAERVATVSHTSHAMSRQVADAGSSVERAASQLSNAEFNTFHAMAKLQEEEKRHSSKSLFFGAAGAALLLAGLPLLVLEVPALVAGAALSGARIGVGAASVAAGGFGVGGAKRAHGRAELAMNRYKQEGGLLVHVQKLAGSARGMTDATRKLQRGLQRVDGVLAMLKDRVAALQSALSSNQPALASLALSKLLQLAQALASPPCYLPSHEVEVDMLLGDREAADVVAVWKEERWAEAKAAEVQAERAAAVAAAVAAAMAAEAAAGAAGVGAADALDSASEASAVTAGKDLGDGGSSTSSDWVDL
eukprot:TRINITY_DN46630_c0_g1_i1.p1 TRINITY_DN46630_c0_g1~~TRINITY_DN46630_c0_g1_i1.p1  ORF type:complete len:443 (-),score=28.67 TRINITY_DN46630_c0_g1_i1:307-1635(-)